MTWGEALTAFSLAAALVTVTPGIDTALVLRTAAVEGGWRAFCAGLGICAGCLAWGVIAAFGLGALLAVSETAYTILRWAGAGYLVYLGARMILGARGGRDAPGETVRAETIRAGSAAGWVARGVGTNILNPKIGVFYVTFLPQFVPAGADLTSFTLLLAAIHVGETLLWFGVLIGATRPLAALIRRPGVVRALDRLTGGVLIAFGVRLAAEARRV